MTDGVVTGGWSFVIAAYAVTGGALLAYGAMLVMKLRDAAAGAARDAGRDHP